MPPPRLSLHLFKVSVVEHERLRQEDCKYPRERGQGAVTFIVPALGDRARRIAKSSRAAWAPT